MSVPSRRNGDSLVCHGERVEYVLSVGEGVELELYVGPVGEGQSGYLAAGVDVKTVDQLTTNVEQTHEVCVADARRTAHSDHKVRLCCHTCKPSVTGH